MGKKKICLDGLKKVLNPKEMKNVLGGSISCTVSCYGIELQGYCAFDTCAECEDQVWPGCYVLYGSCTGC